MGANPGQQPAPVAETRFSADGFWWWDGAEWKAAMSPDRLWRWNGQTWIPARSGPAPSGSNTGLAIGVTIAVFAGVLVLVTALTVVVLYTMGGQISNVFSNVTSALSSP